MMKQNFIVFYFFICPIFINAQNADKLVVYFAFDSYEIGNSSSQIDSFLSNKGFSEIKITGHCDSFGSHVYNDRLALNRALTVKNYITGKGIPVTLIKILTFGKRSPLNGNSNSSERALNRRVEILLENIIQTDSIVETVIDKEITDSTQVVSKQESASVKQFRKNVESAEIGTSLRLPMLNFEGGRHILLPQSRKTLQLLLSVLKENPALEIEIQGHICCESEGDGLDIDTRTRDLSVNRAKAIYEYLIGKGIDEQRLKYRGFGSSHKLVEERTQANMSMNRRVEIKILKK
jgi:outer membrane protein OmpA-like peptidoglycan-associated protein